MESQPFGAVNRKLLIGDHALIKVAPKCDIVMRLNSFLERRVDFNLILICSLALKG